MKQLLEIKDFLHMYNKNNLLVKQYKQMPQLSISLHLVRFFWHYFLVKYLMVILIIITLFFSCNSKKGNIKEDFTKLQSKEVVISLNRMQHNINGIDTLLTDFTDSELKLVIYSDSTACSSCAMKDVYLWEEFIDNTEKYDERLKYYFIYAPRFNKVKETKFSLLGSLLDYPVFIDTAQVFAKENPHLPNNPQLHTFLLDKENKVILVGNPLNNPKIEEMFYKIVEERLGKK